MRAATWARCCTNRARRIGGAKGAASPRACLFLDFDHTTLCARSGLCWWVVYLQSGFVLYRKWTHGILCRHSRNRRDLLSLDRAQG